MANGDARQSDLISRVGAEDWLTSEGERIDIVLGLHGHNSIKVTQYSAIHPFILGICPECKRMAFTMMVQRDVDDYLPLHFASAGYVLDIARHEREMSRRALELLGERDDIPF